MAPTPIPRIPPPPARVPSGPAARPVPFLAPARGLRPAPREVFASTPPDPALAPAFGLADCLALGVLPWARSGGELLVFVQSPRHLAAARDRLVAQFGPFLRPVEIPRRALDAAIFTHFGPQLAQAAETRVPPAESCRDIDPRRLCRTAALAAACVALAGFAAPFATFAFVFALATLSLLITTAFKFTTALATLRAEALPRPPLLDDAALPSISLLIALYREEDIADRLVRRMAALDYPRDRLDLILVVEDDDHATRAALLGADLPPWMRLLAAPEGTIRTKPRALNLALDVAQGDIIGVYDAEDAPEPDQLRKVAAAFAAAPPRIACVQAQLDFYNPRKNWLARCFTMEYALWFRLILPGIERLRLPLPLGGTSVFLRRDTLRALGGWDAHNVTEDADLGIRLARHGYETRMIQSTTYEEANCRALPWVRQRSRWIKGYLITYLVHMRHPRQLWRQLGPRGFVGFQTIVLGSLSQTFLGPLLWTLWTIPLGLGHPLTGLLPPQALALIGTLFLGAEVLGTLLSLIALRRSGQRIHPLWIPTLHAYFPLGTVAAVKALAELLSAPFYWDKTHHGQFHD